MARGNKINRPKTFKFTSGYICAVATYLQGHGRDTGIEDTLKCIGEFNKDEVDDLDWDILADHGFVERDGCTFKPSSV